MMSWRVFWSLLAGPLLALSSAPSGATLIGDRVECDTSLELGSLDCVPSGVRTLDPFPASANVVDPGVEFELLLTGGPFARQALFEVNIGAGSVRLDPTFPGTANFQFSFASELILSDLDWVGMPQGEIVGIANLAFQFTEVNRREPFDTSDIKFDPHRVRILLGDTVWESDSFLSFDLVTTDPVTTVPVPGTLALFLAGIAGVGLTGAQRRAARRSRGLTCR